jgi:hypothetical protein
MAGVGIRQAPLTPEIAIDASFFAARCAETPQTYSS